MFLVVIKMHVLFVMLRVGYVSCHILLGQELYKLHHNHHNSTRDIERLRPYVYIVYTTIVILRGRCFRWCGVPIGRDEHHFIHLENKIIALNK